MTTLRSFLVLAAFLASPFLGTHSSLSLHAQTLSGLRGTVTDKTGAVVPSAKVTMINQDTGEHRSTTTSATGNYEISSLPVGRYKVRIEISGFAVSEQNVTVGIGQASSLNIVLFLGSGRPKGGTIKIKVIDANGSGVAGAAITIIAKNGQTLVSDVSDHSGTYESSALDGDYTIKATSGTSRHDEKQIRMKSGQTKEVKLTLQ